MSVSMAVDAVGLEARAAELGKRSIKREAKLAGLELAIACMDLTTLEGADTVGKIRSLCAKARQPNPSDARIPAVAAVCVYPKLVAIARLALVGSEVKVASVATAFPSGQSFLNVRLAEVQEALAAGADEIDMVIDRGAFLAGQTRLVAKEVAAFKQACGDKHLKVILETGELGSYDSIRQASWLAMEAGADFIKTSTGKVAPAATPAVALCMMEAIRDFYEVRGRQVGFKPAGGIRTAKQALHYLVLLQETLGAQWASSEYFRLGASTLLNDILMQIEKERSGAYQASLYFSLDS